MVIFFGGSFPGGNCPVGIIRVVIFRVGVFMLPVRQDSLHFDSIMNPTHYESIKCDLR